MQAQTYEVTVQIKKVGNPVRYEDVNQLVEATKNLKVSFLGKTLDFLGFKTRKGIMKNSVTKRQSTFDFDKGASVHPCIELAEELLEEGILNRQEMLQFCKDLQKDIYNEVYGLNQQKQ